MTYLEKFLSDHSEFNLPEQTDFLAHHGIEGQKWGVQNGPPYPLDEETHDDVVDGQGSVTKKKAKPTREERAAEKQRKKAEKEERKEAKRQKKAEKKAQKEAKINEKNQKIKDKIINEGDLEACKKNAKIFTNDEIAQVIYRHNTLTNLNKLSGNPTIDKINAYAAQSPNVKAGDFLDKMNKVVLDADKMTNMAVKGIGIYNTIADINNANGGKEMKKIGLAPEKVTTNKTYKNGQLVNEEVINGSGKTVNQYDLNKTTTSEEYEDDFLKKKSTTTFKDGNASTKTYTYNKPQDSGTTKNTTETKKESTAKSSPVTTKSSKSNSSSDDVIRLDNGVVEDTPRSYTPNWTYASRTSRNDDIIDSTFTEVYSNPTTLHAVDNFISGTKQMQLTQLSSQYLLEDYSKRK